MSYEEVASLLMRHTGSNLLSDQSIWAIVVEKAVRASQQQQSQVKAVLEKDKIPAVKQEVDLYSKRTKEVLFFDDGIQVKEQKQKRNKEPVAKKKRVNTDVVKLEKRDGSFLYLTAGINEAGQEIVSLEDTIGAALSSEYAGKRTKLNLVAITDGAKAIRNRLLAIFGTTVTVILDWYHLDKKVRELIAMVARNKKEREQHLEFILSHLWKGQTNAVLRYLSTKVKARNEERRQELITYLKKHKREIINYEERQQIGKTIGSGQAENAVNQVIGVRQKKKAMSWSRKGSKALAVLKTLELNCQWNSFWGFNPLAA